MFTNDIAVFLAEAFQPIMLFDPTERFFPVAPEEWLNKVSIESWNDAATHERGTAVMEADRSATSFDNSNVQAGSHYPAGTHIDLSNDPPNGIGQPFPFDFSLQDLFLTVGGWDDISTTTSSLSGFTEGSIEYLDMLFRNLSSNLNPSLISEDLNPSTQFTVPRIVAPTIITEVEWAGMYLKLDQNRVANNPGERPDFPPLLIGSGNTATDGSIYNLNSYIALTYYMLYPAMEPSPLVDSEGVLKREGQWEAITVYLKAPLADNQTDEDGRPNFSIANGDPKIVERARFFAYSRGYNRGEDLDSPLNAEVRFRNDVTQFTGPQNIIQFTGTHAFAYVSAGTHKNFFEMGALINTGNASQSEFGNFLNAAGTALMGAAGGLAGICAVGIATVGAAALCFEIAGALFLIGFLLYWLAPFSKDDPPISELPNPASPDLTRDGGPAALPSGQSVPTVSGLQPTGNAVEALLRVVNMFKFDSTPLVTTYPQGVPYKAEMPTWWNFPGRWGVRILNQATNEWDSGTRRVDSFGRSRAYWNTYQLVSFLNDPERVIDGVTA